MVGWRVSIIMHLELFVPKELKNILEVMKIWEKLFKGTNQPATTNVIANGIIYANYNFMSLLGL